MCDSKWILTYPEMETIGNYVYFFGGMFNGNYHKEIYALKDDFTGSWSHAGNMNDGRAWFCSVPHCAGPSLYRLISYILVGIIRHLVYGGEDNFTQHLYNIDNICRNSIKYR